MKRTFKKIFASILTIALISSVCAIAPVMAEGETTATKMEFNKAYKAWWPTDLPPTTIVPSYGSVETNKSLAKNASSSSHLNKEYFGTVPASNFKFYKMETEGGYIEVAIPAAEEGYNIKTVGVTVSMDTKASTTDGSDYLNILDYAYSTDSGATWVPIANPTYTDHGVATLYKQRWQAFCEVLKVPANTTHVKITRNGVPATNGGSNTYDGVCGVQFGYMPAEMGDVLEFDAGNNEKVIEFINSGIIADGGFGWNSYGSDTDSDGAKEYGFGVQYGKSVTINAVEGYKITSVSGTVQSGNAQRARARITLGEEEFVSTEYTHPFNLTNVAGADTLTITGTCSDEAADNGTGSSEWTIYDLKITMEKDVEELAMAVKSAVKGAEQVDVSVQVSGRDSAADSSMKLLVVGYAGEVMSDVKILTVNKTDISDEHSTSLSADTTSVRAFLWKDLSTLVPILPATTAFPVR